MKNFSEIKNYVKSAFKEKNIPQDEVNKLLTEVLKTDLTGLLKTDKISHFNSARIKTAVKKRRKGMPLTKIFKKAYFYGEEFYVNDNVLSPRPETELLVENALKYIGKETRVLDLCTGSGAIALSICKNSSSTVSASDISRKALRVVRKNAKTHACRVTVIKSDLFENIEGIFDVIVCNPPYVRSDEICRLEREVKKYDPVLALDGGKDGLDFYRAVIKECGQHLTKSGIILFEVGHTQATEVGKMLNDENFKTEIVRDYAQINRIVIGKLN